MNIPHSAKFDEQNFDKLIVGFIGELLKENYLVGKLGRIAGYSSNLSNCATVKLLHFTVVMLILAKIFITMVYSFTKHFILF